tara:strand:- start:117 stop:413 length:297 start_codon:yes stop_codon:yes gene_type:complete
MKFINGLIAFVFIGIPAILWWADVWVTGTTPQAKVQEVSENLEINTLMQDMYAHQDLVDAFNKKEISRSEYIREMEKLKKKIEREGKKTKKKVENSLE